ncbi:unnamed protein product, partial [Echinostoma caproni]|uniref:VWFD domain-containing protein n=1 Tax=Echinostoma caproni TaxID=27848 RepID=A0A183ATW5_9TREM
MTDYDLEVLVDWTKTGGYTHVDYNGTIFEWNDEVRIQMPMEKSEVILRSRELSGSSAYAVQQVAGGGLGSNCGANICGTTSSGLNFPVSTAATSAVSKPTVTSSLILATTPSTTVSVTQQRVTSNVSCNPVQHSDTQAVTTPSVEEPHPNPVSILAGTFTSPGEVGSHPGPSGSTTTTTTPSTQATSTATFSSTSTPIYQVISLMLDADAGLPFIATSTSVFPERTFFAFDAVTWTMRMLCDVDSVCQAVDYLQ